MKIFSLLNKFNQDRDMFKLFLIFCFMSYVCTKSIAILENDNVIANFSTLNDTNKAFEVFASPVKNDLSVLGPTTFLNIVTGGKSTFLYTDEKKCTCEQETLKMPTVTFFSTSDDV